MPLIGELHKLPGWIVPEHGRCDRAPRLQHGVVLRQQLLGDADGVFWELHEPKLRRSSSRPTAHDTKAWFIASTRPVVVEAAPRACRGVAGVCTTREPAGPRILMSLAMAEGESRRAICSVGAKSIASPACCLLLVLAGK